MRIDLKSKRVAQYIKAVDNQLLCPKAIKKDMLSKLENSVAEYVDEHPQASVDDLEACFGSPGTIADEYIASLEQDALRASLKKSRFIKRAILLAVGAVILAALITSAVVIIWNAAKKIDYIYVDMDVLDNQMIEEMD